MSENEEPLLAASERTYPVEILLLTSKSLNAMSPAYLCDLVVPCTPNRPLWSQDKIA